MNGTIHSFRSAAIVLAACLACGSGQAQSTAPAPQSDTPPPASGPPTDRPVPPQPGKGTVQEPLATKLDRSNGVIHPAPGVDPQMAKPTPDLGPQSTPVVPPPGTPENKPNVQPK